MVKLIDTLEKYNKPFIFATVFSSIFIRYIYYGFHYYYQLDDYIQYYNFASSLDYGKLISNEGLLSARPLAGLFDLFIWSKLFNVMIVGVFIISLMYTFSAILFHSLFKKFYGSGIIFISVFTLLPLGIEGTYWMSASTRIITGLFFSSVAITFFQNFCDTHKFRYLFLWIPLQFISFCFYEQILVFSLTLTFIIMFHNFSDENHHKSKKNSLIGLISIVNVFIYFIFTIKFADKGMYTARMELALPNTPYYYKVFLPEILKQIKSAFIEGGLFILMKGFYRGAKLIIIDFNWLYFIGILFIAYFYFLISKTSIEHNKTQTSSFRIILPFITGITLASAPITPFLFLSNPWFSLRSTVSSFAGIALILDSFLRLIIKNKKIVLHTITAVFIFVCCVSSVSEIHDYKKTYEYDTLVINVIKQEIEGKTDLGNIGIINLNASYLEDCNYYFHEHIHGITESNWALFGGLASISSEIYGNVIPLAADEQYYYSEWNRDIKRIDNFDTLFYWDEKKLQLLPLAVETTDNISFMLYFDDKTLCASIWEDGNHGYIKLY